MKTVIYTDGSIYPNPGPGGYGAFLIYGDHTRYIKGGYKYTTINRMELMAVLKPLLLLSRPGPVQIYSDSQYVVNSMTQNRARGWMFRRKPVSNADIWEWVLRADMVHDITWTWVRGHNGNEGNTVADELAKEGRTETDLKEDTGFPCYREIQRVDRQEVTLETLQDCPFGD